MQIVLLKIDNNKYFGHLDTQRHLVPNYEHMSFIYIIILYYIYMLLMTYE